ncbi:MAG: helix-turn-helix transcriptional regulator [Myxococcota bacterium]
MDTRENDEITDLARERTTLAITIAFFVMILVVTISDLVIDYRAGTTIAHLLIEGAISMVAAVGIAFLVARLQTLRRTASDLEGELQASQKELEETRREAEKWRDETRDILRGLGEAIDRQFERWELTPAEKEVALLLLKGLSHKDIAGVRDVSPHTTRQQAHAVYKKAGVEGRADLAAFFLEDLLLPQQRLASSD